MATITRTSATVTVATDCEDADWKRARSDEMYPFREEAVGGEPGLGKRMTHFDRSRLIFSLSKQEKQMLSPRTIGVGFIASIIVAALAPAGVASAATQTTAGARLHARLTMQRARIETPASRPRVSRLGLEALGVTPSYGYGDDYPSHGSAAYRNDSGPSRFEPRGVPGEGRVAAADEGFFGYPAHQGWVSYEPVDDTYGRQTPDYGPGYTYAAPVSPYRWAYSSENFPGTEFMGGR
jgi:hypothetical protein